MNAKNTDHESGEGEGEEGEEEEEEEEKQDEMGGGGEMGGEEAMIAFDSPMANVVSAPNNPEVPLVLDLVNTDEDSHVNKADTTDNHEHHNKTKKLNDSPGISNIVML